MNNHDLFSVPSRYPDAPGYAKGSATSRKAAETVWKPTERQNLILTALGDHPMTDHQLSQWTGLAMACVQPRRSDLSNMLPPKVIDSGERRLTPYGKLATVWRLA